MGDWCESRLLIPSLIPRCTNSPHRDRLPGRGSEMLSLANPGRARELGQKKKEKELPGLSGLGWCGVAVHVACGYLAYHAYPVYFAYSAAFC